MPLSRSGVNWDSLQGQDTVGTSRFPDTRTPGAYDPAGKSGVDWGAHVPSAIPNPVEDFSNLLSWAQRGIQNLPEDTPLTTKLYNAGAGWKWLENETARGAFNVTQRLAPWAAGLVGFGLAGPIGSRIAQLGTGGALAAMAGLAAEGAIGGAAAGATQALVEDEPVLPNTVGGALSGAALGGVIGKLSGASRKLAEQYAMRGALPFPLLEDIAKNTPNLSAKRLAALRRNVASKAFRALVPEGETRASMGEVRWNRARQAARVAAKAVTSFEAEPGPIARVMEAMWKRATKPNKHIPLERAMDDVKQFWGSWVTRAAIALRRDALAFPDGVGQEAATALERIVDLTFGYEGKLVEKMQRLIAGVPKHELDEGLFNYLTGQVHGPLSAEGTAAAQGWRDMADNMFGALDSRGVRELAPESHPVGQGELFPEIAQAARAAPDQDMKMIPLQYRKNYVPFYREPGATAGLRKPGTPEREAAIDKLIDTGHAPDRATAEKLLDIMLDDSGRSVPIEIRGGVAQHSREVMLDLPTIKDARVWMRRYIHEHARRAAEAEVLGGQDQMFHEWMKRLKEHDGDWNRFEDFFRLAVNRPSQEQLKYAGLARGTGDAMNMAYLGPRVGILQFMQLSNTAARFGWRSLMEGIVGTIRNPEARALAREAGVTLPTFNLQSGEVDAMGKMGRFWIEWVTQMPRMDRAVRIVSGIAAGTEAQRLASRVMDASSVVGRRLQYLGIDPEQVIQQGGKLTREQVMAAMRNGSMKTQFASSAMDMPMQWRTGAGKLVFKLRTFAKQQTTFVNGMVDDAMKGDVAPLARYLITYPTIYMAMRPYLDLLSSKPTLDDADQEVLDRIRNALEGAAWSGMFGGLGDFINQVAASDAGRLMSLPLGVAAATTLGTGRDVFKAVTEGDIDPLARRASRTPFALPYHLYQKLAGQQ